MALYKQDRRVIGQGFTDSNGRLDVYGAIEGDTLRAVSFDGGLAGNATKRRMGRIRAVGEVESRLIRLQSTYQLQRVSNDQAHDVYSTDGNLSLHLESGSLPRNEAYLVVMPPGAIPGPLPEGLVLVGDSYDVIASGALISCGMTRPWSAPRQRRRDWGFIAGILLARRGKLCRASSTQSKQQWLCR